MSESLLVLTSLRTLKNYDGALYHLIKSKIVNESVSGIGESNYRDELRDRQNNYHESDLEVNVAAVILEVSCFDHVNERREDRVGRVLDSLQQRPQPVDHDFALCVEEHERVANSSTRSRQPRPCHAHADARRALRALQARGLDHRPDPLHVLEYFLPNISMSYLQRGPILSSAPLSTTMRQPYATNTLNFINCYNNSAPTAQISSNKVLGYFCDNINVKCNVNK